MSEPKAIAVARATKPAPDAPEAQGSADSERRGTFTGDHPLAGDTGRDRSATEWTHEVQSWLDPQHWPQPGWSSSRLRRSGLHLYDSYVLHQCRVRYLELETDFRTVFGNWSYGMLGGEPVDVVTGQCAVGLLHGARKALEQPDPDLLAVSSTLDLVERCIVWATPSYLLAARVPSLRRRLDQEVPAEVREVLEPLLRRLAQATDGAGGGRLQVPLHELRSAIDEATSVLNTAVTERQITSGLQLERLTILRDRGMVLLGVLVLLLPMLMPAVPPGSGARLTVPFVLRFVPLAASDAWLSGAAVALFGAAGGFLSGLLQARATTVSTAEYQDSVLRLELRPIVGATIAIVLFVLLSWGIVPGVAITSGGSFLLLAFLSGFSERYFLRLLELKPDEAQDAAKSATGTFAAVPAREAARAALLRPSGHGGGGGSTPSSSGSANGSSGGRNGTNGTNGNGSYGTGGGRLGATLADGPFTEASPCDQLADQPVRAGEAPGVPVVGALYRDGPRSTGYDENRS